MPLRPSASSVFAAVFLVSAVTAARAQAPPAGTDVYHVHFAKAAPGQAVALGDALRTPDPKAPMADHFIVLRHAEGDDWDYCVIQHLGPKATVEITSAPVTPATNIRDWHTDSFAVGPSWGEFSKAMSAPGGVYIVSEFRAVPGHRDQLLKSLTAPTPGSKNPPTAVLLTHLEGGPWNFVSLQRYNSWTDFGADQTAATAPGGGEDGWGEVRQHVGFHRDTLATRVPLK